MKSKEIIVQVKTRIMHVAVVLMVCFLSLCGSKWDLSVPGIEEVMALLGLFCVAIAACGKLWCMLYSAGYTAQKLVIKGPYSICRKPGVLFSLIGIVGMGLGSATFTVPLVLFTAFFIYYYFTVRKEEERLLLLHGEAFKAYCSKTSRFLPCFRNFHEPDQYTLNPRIFRKFAVNAIPWIVLFSLWEVFEFLRLEKWIPTYFNIW